MVHRHLLNVNLSLAVERLTADQMDEQRVQNVAYQYLCRLEEAKRSVQVEILSLVYLLSFVAGSFFLLFSGGLRLAWVRNFLLPLSWRRY